MAATKKVTENKLVNPVGAEYKKSAIAERAMLVELSCRRWHPHATDRVISDEVATTHNADRSMGKYRKRLIKKDKLLPVLAVINRVRELFYFYTLPWSNDGQRLLTNTGYFEFSTKLKELQTQFSAEVATFIDAYPDLVKEAKSCIARFDPADYPSVAQMKSKFEISIAISPVPSGADFRVDMGDQEAARIRREIEARAEETVKQAMGAVVERLKEVVAHAAKRLNAYSVGKDGKVENTFRDSLVTNIVELLEVVPALNVTNDPALTKFADEIRKGLTQHPATVLRDDEKIRKDTARRAEEILSKMEAFIA